MAARLLFLSRSISALPSPAGFRSFYSLHEPLKFTISGVVTHDSPFPPKRGDRPSQRSTPSFESEIASPKGARRMPNMSPSQCIQIFCEKLQYYRQRSYGDQLKCEIYSQGFHTAIHLKQHYRDAHDITAEGKKACRCGCYFRRVKDRIVHSRKRCPLRAKEGINGLKWRMIKEFLDTEPKWMWKKGI